MTLVVAYAAAVALLLVAGVVKLRAPLGAARMIATLLPPRAPRALRRPAGLLALARTLGAAEVLLVVAALVAPGPIPHTLVALGYVAFAAVADRGRRAGATSCGCLGGDDAPPGRRHVALDLALAAGAAATAGTGSLAGPLTRGAGGATCLVLGLLLAALVRLLLTSAAALSAQVHA